MLEHAVLLLQPSNVLGRREILAGDTGEPIGYAQWRTPTGRLPWLGRGVFEVHEREDDPLLCSVRRCWSLLPWYEVCDAEDHRVGRILGSILRDRQEHRCAVRCPDGPGQVVYQTPAGQRLARVDRDRSGDRLTFESIIDHEPFVKMLLLGAVLLG